MLSWKSLLALDMLLCLFLDTTICASYFYKRVSMNLCQQKQCNQKTILIIIVFSIADNKISHSLTRGGPPSRQARDRTSTSSSVRDRSALYLSRAEAISSTAGSTQPVSSWNASHSSPYIEVKGLNRERPLCRVTIGAATIYCIF